MPRRKLASIEISNHQNYILPVFGFIDAVAIQHSAVNLNRYHQMRFVVGMLLEKRIANAYPNSIGPIFVELFLDDHYFEVSIREKGTPVWYDFAYDIDAPMTDSAKLSNYLAGICVDEVGMEKLGSEGQRIFVRKNLLEPVTYDVLKPYPETVVLDTNFTIRPVQTNEEIMEAIRCLHSEYGYSYSYERLYFLDSFRKMLDSGEIMSFLAVNDHGQTAGHFALVFSDMYENMPELSAVVIRKEFRGLGLFNRFMTYCDGLAEEKHLRAIMGQPVAFHPMSQKAFLHANYTATSLILSYIGSEIKSEYNKNGERLSLCAGVKLFDKTAHSTIYPPRAIAPFVGKIYENLGLRYDLGEGACFEEASCISVNTNRVLKMSGIIITSADENITEDLRHAVKSALWQKSEMIELVLSLNSPSCEKAYEAAMENGFVFSGMIPGGANADYLLLQLLPEAPDYAKLVTVGEFEELKNQVIALNQ